MQTVNANHELRSQDTRWYFIGEYSLSKLLTGLEKGDLTTDDFLSQMVRDLGLPVKCGEKVEIILKNLTKEALARFKQRRVELPGRMRIFCQRKMVDEKIEGGWGYFVIERSTEASSSDCKEACHHYDIYFYEERG